MITLSTPHFICLAMLAAVGLANIIILTVIVIGGAFSRSVDPAIDPNTSESTAQSMTAAEHYALAVQKAREECDCRCHNERMQSGLRCMDCINSICDEGTAE